MPVNCSKVWGRQQKNFCHQNDCESAVQSRYWWRMNAAGVKWSTRVDWHLITATMMARVTPVKLLWNCNYSPPLRFLFLSNVGDSSSQRRLHPSPVSPHPTSIPHVLIASRLIRGDRMICRRREWPCTAAPPHPKIVLISHNNFTH